MLMSFAINQKQVRHNSSYRFHTDLLRIFYYGFTRVVYRKYLLDFIIWLLQFVNENKHMKIPFCVFWTNENYRYGITVVAYLSNTI